MANAAHSANVYTRQRLGVSRHQRFAECGLLALGKMASLLSVNQKHSAKCTFVECFSGTLGKIIFSYFGFQFFSVGFLHYLDQHARIWHNFKTICYISLVYFFSLNFFGKYKFELQLHRIMTFHECENDIHVTDYCFRPYLGRDLKFRTSSSRNMTTNLWTNSFKIV
jgi:hypothetical protein